MEEESTSHDVTSIHEVLRLFWILRSWELLCVPFTFDWCPKLFFAFINHTKFFWYWLKRFLALYWQSMTIVVAPIALLPVIMIDDKPENRCLYVLLLVSMFWSTVALPLPVTSMLPVALFPMLGILSSNETCKAYMSEENMSFICELIIALTVQHCNLHKRLALKIISVIGCSQRKLNFGLTFVTMFVSMWISNSVSITLMVPIIRAVLEGLENEGVCKLYVDDDENHERSSSWHHLGHHGAKKPTKITLCYFMGAAYVTSIGNCGSIIGSATNYALKHFYEHKFNGQTVDYFHWMYFNVPLMLINYIATWIYLQWYFMGLFRVTSDEAKEYNLGSEGEKIVRKVIRKRYEELGPISVCEIQVAVLFVIGVALYILDSALDTGYSSAPIAVIIVVFMFVLPSKWKWLNFFKRKQFAFPKRRAHSLINWRYINRKLPWSLFFLLGCGFALARGGEVSGMSKMLGNQLSNLLIGLPLPFLLFLICIFIQVITEFVSSIAIVNVILPILAELSLRVKVHPLYLMLPATISCSMGFHTIFGTPHNLIAAEVANIRTKDIAIAGLGPSIFSFITIWTVFPTWGRVVYPEISTFPSWAQSNATAI